MERTEQLQDTAINSKKATFCTLLKRVNITLACGIVVMQPL